MLSRLCGYSRVLRYKRGMQIWVPRGKLLLWLTWRCIAELGLDTVDLSKNTVDLSQDTVDLAATRKTNPSFPFWLARAKARTRLTPLGSTVYN